MTPADPDVITWRSLATEAEQALRAAGLPSPEVDARRIVEQASGNEGVDYTLGLDEHPTHRSLVFFERMLERRKLGEPLQYVLGRWGFRELDLFVDARVLIPRPETEVVVDVALGELDRLRTTTRDRDPSRPLVAVDLGTGSGAIALSLARERPGTEVWATDRSADAIDVARANLAGIGASATTVTLAEGTWFEALPTDLRGRLDLVVSNPPYVAIADSLPSEVAAWEPHGALFAGDDGLDDIEQLIPQAAQWLAEPGALVLECAPTQAGLVATMAREAGFEDVRIERDLAGRDRVLVARLGDPA